MVAVLTGSSGCAASVTPTPNPPTAAPAAASLPAPAATVSAPLPSEPIAIVLWHAWRGDPFEKLLTETAGRFSASHPGITVEPVCVGNEEDVPEKAIAAVQAGDPPDLVVAGAHDIVAFVEAGAIAPLGPYVDDPEIGLTKEDRADIFAGCWESGIFPEFGGQVFSFPFSKGALGMYYNKTFLDRTGIGQVPATWADLEAACKTLSRSDIPGLAWSTSASTFDGFLYSRGARQLSEDQTRAVFNGPEGVEALDFLTRLGDAGAALRVVSDEAARAMFAQGRVAFAFGSTADMARYAAAIADAGASFAWGCTSIPQADANAPQTVLYGADICVFQTTEARQRAAWQFIRWLSGTEETANWACASGSMPLRASAVQELAISGYLDENPIVKEAYDTVIPYARPEPNVRGEQEIRRIIEDAWAAALTGAQTPKQALDEAVAKADEALAAKR